VAHVTGEGSAERQIAAVVELAREVLGDDLIAVYLYGSATLGGLQNHSDIDLFMVSGRSLSGVEKRRVVDGLLEISSDPAWGAPSWHDTRPLEVTIAARPEIDPWRFPPAMELQYGEWLRTELAAGNVLPDDPTRTPTSRCFSRASDARAVPSWGRQRGSRSVRSLRPTSPGRCSKASRRFGRASRPALTRPTAC
jgi:predicted nucleotidyltransferase